VSEARNYPTTTKVTTERTAAKHSDSKGAEIWAVWENLFV
jgi:hypothetical protein